MRGRARPHPLNACCASCNFCSTLLRVTNRAASISDLCVDKCTTRKPGVINMVAVDELRVFWPDGTESDHELHRPEASNLPPPKKHFGDRWLVTGRVGAVGSREGPPGGDVATAVATAAKVVHPDA